ncbi:MAG TPA: RagB/SusD family nutrient uptake outer membrane protein, partial [Agriterribacter sp.]|nr:RagB/SusD family nutrient uptake outer membrane protein [Agriterribacter sp.]
RAGLLDLPSGLTKDQFRAKVMAEEAIEFIGEGKRHYDLVRWGVFKQMMDKRKLSSWVLDYGGVEEEYINAPLPQEELDLNKWTQNK